MLLIYMFMCMLISKHNNSKFPKSPNPHSKCGFGNGVEFGRTVLQKKKKCPVILLNNTFRPFQNSLEACSVLVHCVTVHCTPVKNNETGKAFYLATSNTVIYFQLSQLTMDITCSRFFCSFVVLVFYF